MAARMINTREVLKTAEETGGGDLIQTWGRGGGWDGGDIYWWGEVQRWIRLWVGIQDGGVEWTRDA